MKNTTCFDFIYIKRIFFYLHFVFFDDFLRITSDFYFIFKKCSRYAVGYWLLCEFCFYMLKSVIINKRVFLQYFNIIYYACIVLIVIVNDNLSLVVLV